MTPRELLDLIDVYGWDYYQFDHSLKNDSAMAGVDLGNLAENIDYLYETLWDFRNEFYDRLEELVLKEE